MGIPGIRNLAKVCAVLLFSLMLAACGADDGDDDPAATGPASDAQPTVAMIEEAEVTAEESPVDMAGTPAPSNIDMSTLPAGATPDSVEPETSTPEGGATVVEDELATPASSPVATPVDVTGDEAAADEGQGSPATPAVGVNGSTQADAAVGDGTTGAAIPGELATPPAANPATPAASPAASPDATTGSATPAAPLAVTGCDVEDVPPFTGEQATFSLTTDLNFRTGPGVECDLALDVPLGEFQQVIVIGGPVVRSDDSSEWVQIQVGETIGWVALEFLAPVE